MLWTGQILTATLVASAAYARPPGISPRGIPVPTRPLEWNDVNFITTSDIHGWLLGHQHATWPEPNYSGDFGDLASFVAHLRAEADARGVDLLVIDQGDHHDGSGLVSSSPSGASLTDEIIAMLNYDVLAIGNHELYQFTTAREVYDAVGQWNGRFVTSNTNLTIGRETVPIGEPFVRFKTKQGRTVTAFGVLYDFPVYDKGITIQPPAVLVHEPWFRNAIAMDADFFVLAGHMPVRGEDSDWQLVLDAIRSEHPQTPVFIFGGHTHIRDCVQLDDYSISLEPGRYMETVGWVSSDLPSSGKLDVSRRYINANRPSYKFHTRQDASFDTPLGRNISDRLAALAASLNVSTPIGNSPKDLFLSRHEFGHPSSVLTVFAKDVLPSVVVDTRRHPKPKLIVSNSGSQRFDLFKGTFDRNDELTVSPFKSTFLVVELPVWIARNITDQLNRQGSSQLRSRDADVDAAFATWQHAQWVDSQVAAGDAQKAFLPHHGRTLGYVTKDACPGQGDDVEHIPVPHTWNIPEFISSDFPEGKHDIVDVVFMDFFIGDFVRAVHALDPSSTVKASDAEVYAEGIDVSSVWGMYADKHWQ